MESKTFEYEKTIVNVFYTCVPSKKELEEACSLFMRNIEQKEKADVAASTKD